jgi:hypothetical protein
MQATIAHPVAYQRGCDSPGEGCAAVAGGALFISLISRENNTRITTRTRKKFAARAARTSEDAQRTLGYPGAIQQVSS